MVTVSEAEAETVAVGSAVPVASETEIERDSVWEPVGD